MDNAMSAMFYGAAASLVTFAIYELTCSNLISSIKNKVKKITKMVELINNIDGDNKQDVTILKHVTNSSIIYEYAYMGQNYNISLPYDKSKFLEMLELQATLIKEDGTEIDITQYPGIPYFLSAGTMGGKSIVVTNYETDHQHEYAENEIPMYCVEIMSE